MANDGSCVMNHKTDGVQSKLTVAAIIITYNRKKLLLLCLTALLKQMRALDKIYIVDNASTDGSLEYLEEHRVLCNPVVEWYELGQNLGCSGGFHHGVQKGYVAGYDWLWVMDDDALPEANALALLLDSAVPNACMYSAYLVHGTRNFTEPVPLACGSRGFQTYLTIPNGADAKLVEGVGGPPLGLLIPRNVIEKVGFPREDIFIFGEYEYLIRIREAGFKVYYRMDSIVWHPGQNIRMLKLPLRLKYFGRGEMWVDYPFYTAKIWKEYYGIRNYVFLSLRSRPRRCLSMLLIIYVALVDAGLKIYYGDQKFKRTGYLLRGLFDGICGNMGKRVEPF